jgi:putative IMPACT (imprinted ancient) family translation regulator
LLDILTLKVRPWKMRLAAHVHGSVCHRYTNIKLGAGGLARAYGGTAAECLRIAERVPIVTMIRLGVRCDFSDLARMKARLKDLGADVEQETFDATGVTLHLRLPQDVVEDAKARIVDISRGRHEAYELD